MIFKNEFAKWATAYELGGRSVQRWGALAIFSGLVTFAFDLLFALTLQRFFISIGLINGENATAFLGELRSPSVEAAFFLLIGALRATAIWVNSVATGTSQVAFESTARQKISQWALWEGRASTGRVSTLFNDVAVCSGAAVSTSYYLISRLLMIAASLLTLLYYSPILTAVIVALLVVVSPLHRLLDHWITRTSATIQQSLSAVSDRLMRGVKNSIFLHIHGMFGTEVIGQRKLVGNYERASRRYYALASGRGVIPQILGLGVVVLVATQGAGVFAQNKGDLVAYLYLVIRFFQTFSDAARVTANIRGNWPRLKVLVTWYKTEFMPARSKMDVEISESRIRPAIPDSVGLELQNVTFSWGEAGNVLTNTSLSFPAGSSTVITGASGAGKTTLLLLLCRLVTPSEGKVLALFPDGSHDVQNVRQQILSATAYVGPDPFVISGTVRDFLLFGQEREIDDLELFASLDQAHCDFIRALPDGLGHFLAEQGGGLSAGQKQRLSIARALLRRPRLLLLDEATSNLDSESEQAIIDTIQSLRGTVTIVAVTHREALKTLADTILNFEGNGQVRVMEKIETSQNQAGIRGYT